MSKCQLFPDDRKPDGVRTDGGGLRTAIACRPEEPEHQRHLSGPAVALPPGQGTARAEHQQRGLPHYVSQALPRQRLHGRTQP